MFDLLIERDREEALRSSKRRLTFPDGSVRDVEAFRVVWRWMDNLIAYEFAADQDEILGYVMKTMEAQGCAEGEALGLVVEYLVIGTEERGGDVTDDNLALYVARRQQATWNAQRRGSDTSEG